MIIKDQERFDKMLKLRLDGKSYLQIAKEFNLSRQRVQQYLAPPEYIRSVIVEKYEGKCADCGLMVGISGHVHHKDTTSEDYNDIGNLELLCISCHRRAHATFDPVHWHSVSLPEDLYIRLKELAGDMTINDFLKRVIQELLDKNKEENEDGKVYKTNTIR